MILAIYRRHSLKCRHLAEGRNYRRCKCPIWLDATIAGREYRKSLKTRNWDDAEDMKMREARTISGATQLAEQKKNQPVTIEEAIESHRQDSIARGLKPESIVRYRSILTAMKKFYAAKGILYIKECDLASLREFRMTWKFAPITVAKTIERLRAFFRFVHENGWTAGNPAEKLKPPKYQQAPTMPFDAEEMARIFAACRSYPDNYRRTDQANARRLRAFVLVLRYTGLRIGDVVTLAIDRVKDGKLFLRTAKTGTTVWCPVPTVVVTALNEVRVPSCPYYFWSGESKPKSAVSDWQRSLAKLFDLASIANGHAHRFRDTYAVELLLAGVPLERVSILLGHSSIRITEKHYSPWVRARQEQLESDIRGAWSHDAFLEAGGKTNEGDKIVPIRKAGR